MFPVRFVGSNAGNVNDSSLVLSLGSSWEGNSKSLTYSKTRFQFQLNISIYHRKLFIVYQVGLKKEMLLNYFADGSGLSVIL